MNISRNHIYTDFLKANEKEPILIFQGSKASGKTADVLIDFGLHLFNKGSIKMQCFSESPKQQTEGLVYDFEQYFKPVLPQLHKDGNKHKYKNGENREITFLNIPNNKRAGDVANSMGSCDLRLIDECNNYTRSTFEKLQIKNSGRVFLTYNPWRKFWVDDLINDRNFLKTTWKDNIKFLSQNQIALFLKWTELGQNAPKGSYNYWRWQVMCEGNFAKMTGKTFTTDNIRFVDKLPEGLHHFIIFADPSNARGGDYFALTLTAIGADGNMYLIDSFSCNKISKEVIAEKIRKWQSDYCVDRTFIETNGQYGLKFYNDCIISKIKVQSWNSRNNKFERIMSNFDVITMKTFLLDTPANREFADQIYTFRPDGKSNDEEEEEDDEFFDDNIDCYTNAIIAYITIFRELKVLF